MARILTNIASSFALVALITPAGAASIMTGAPVAVTQNAQFVREGQSRTLVVGVDIQVGDSIRTGSTGNAQLLFMDNTRMVVGASSTLNIENALFRSSGTAENLAVNFTRGAFRFVSGTSESSAYSVRTPTATLGIRGTSFDLAVDDAGNTWMTLIEGEVRLCSTGRRPACVVVRDNCSVVGLDASGEFSAPETREERDSILKERFAFILSQQGLREQFRSRVELCGVEPPPVLQRLRGITEIFDDQLIEARTERPLDPLEGAMDISPQPAQAVRALTPWPTPRILLPVRPGDGWPMVLGGGATLAVAPQAAPDAPTDSPQPAPIPAIPLPASVWLLLAGLGTMAGGAAGRARRAGRAGTGTHAARRPFDDVRASR